MTKHLWVNLTDLMYPAMRVPMAGSVLSLLINSELGDRRLDGGYLRKKNTGRIDDIFVVIQCIDDARPQAIKAALESIGKEKIGRKVRTRITANPPGGAWTWRG